MITIGGEPSAVVAPLLRQKERLLEVLGGFDEAAWDHPSRCEGWSNRDVIVHLDSTNAFWAFSINAGLAGKPTQFLATFDPVASPAQLVEASDVTSGAQALERYAASSRAFTDLVASLDDAGLRTLAEAPPGHQTVSALLHHAIWDSWIHERDILEPLGRAQEVQPDEVLASLRYVAALAPAFAVSLGKAETGVLGLETTDPTAALAVEIGDSVLVRDAEPGDRPGLTLTGRAVDLLEALSIRRPLDQPVPPDAAWMVSGLAEIFDSERT